MAAKGKGIDYNDGIIAFSVFFSILGFVILWRVFVWFYDMRKHAWRKRKYEGAAEFSEKRPSLLGFIKSLGGPNFSEEEYDEAYCGAKPSRDGELHRRQLPEYFAGNDSAPLLDCCWPCRRGAKAMQPALDTLNYACCMNDVSRLAFYEARVAINAAGNDWEKPSPLHTTPCCVRFCDSYAGCRIKCDEHRVKLNTLCCENAACEFCCGRMTQTLEKVGGQWDIDLTKGMPHVAIGMPHMPKMHMPTLTLPSPPNVQSILRGGRGSGGSAPGSAASPELEAAAAGLAASMAASEEASASVSPAGLSAAAAQAGPSLADLQAAAVAAREDAASTGGRSVG
eukprot:CAMPEP_0197579854 /NCGR_PEP_ID=MMETSP1326-20131121/3765_1 /TAXON_ID=1155430 /ORGANISM="Genus nov. species nov., Strain RCC2288" /LENGTH=338 /DNA_ID=CAMNT_0043143423 /DNA_START=224 /DNA_END=1236 /DNA_ORIENTATION=-